MEMVWSESLESRRLFASGVADLSYGENGLVPGGDNIQDVIGRRKDGAVLFTVNYGSGPGVIAIKPDGTYDETTRYPSYDFSNSVSGGFLLDPAERLYFLGYTGQSPTLFRYGTDGEADPAFTKTRLPQPPTYKGRPVQYFSTGNPLLDSHGRALVTEVAEYYNPPGPNYGPLYTRLYVDRILPDGGRDTSFGDGGRLLVATFPASTPLSFRVAVAPDDKLLVYRINDAHIPVITRYTAAGKIDTTFSSDGTVTVPEPDVYLQTRLAVDNRGRVLMGYTRPADGHGVRVRRFTANGATDTSFGTNGVVTLTNRAFDTSYSYLGLDAAGRIYGGAGEGLFRLSADGALDTTFGTAGVIDTDNALLDFTLPTPEGVYTATRIGDARGIGRFVETETATLDPVSHVLTVTGTTAADRIDVRPASGGGVRVTINDNAARTFTNVSRIQIDALVGEDRVTASAPLPTGVNLGVDNDTFTGTGSAAFTVLGGKGDDVITTGDAADDVQAGEGDDTVSTGNGRDTVVNSAGSDTTDLGAGGGVFGRRDRYDAETNQRPQIITGQGGPKSRYDILTGNGDDRIAVAGGGIFVTAGGGNNRVTALAALGALVTSYDGNSAIVTGDAADRIEVGRGRNRISSAGGADTVFGGIGRDTVNAGPGNDVVIDAGGNNRIHGDDGDDSIRTAGGDDSLYGDSGDDTLRSNAGVDSLDGGDGADRLFPGTGRDLVYGGPGRDRATFDDDLAFDSIETILR